MFTLYLIHASHTDVGYTDTQEKMKAHHVAFIREALEYIRRDPDFIWNCESYWAVEAFLSEATPNETEAFVQAVRKGKIGLSGSYLNMTELIPARVYDKTLACCEKQWKALGLSVRSALTADINGYAWGMADIFANHGITRLMSNIHTHHGYHPLFMKQTPFYWEAPSGRKMLVWNGEHYNLGNELGIAQASWFEYTVQDGISLKNLPEEVKAEQRIEAYVASVLADGYPYDFIPIGVSGGMTDNAPPSTAILDFVRRYNRKHENIHLKMATLDTFFDTLEKQKADIPVYRGDWTDWWADGIGSTPEDVIQYRQAARNFSLCEKMTSAKVREEKQEYRDALKNLMIYAEHTWGYSSSITEPYHPQVNNLRQWKRLYALKALEATEILKENLQQQLGETAVSLGRQLKFRAVNPHDEYVEDMLVIDLEHFYGFQNFIVLDEETRQVVPFQLSRYSRGPEMCIHLQLAPRQTRTYILKEVPQAPLSSAGLKAKTGIEGVDDLFWRMQEKKEQGSCTTEYFTENKYFSLRFEHGSGIASFYDKVRQRELVVPDAFCRAFTPIYERTAPRPGEDYLYVRRNMGRNRKAFRTQREVGRLSDVQVLETGPLFDRVELVYDLASIAYCSVILTLYKQTPRIGADLRIRKDCVWEPENLYLALPFDGKEMWIDKTGCCLRPGIDQLPGTCEDFYCIQNGIALGESGAWIVIACKDSPLISMGGLEAHPIRLMGEKTPCPSQLYAWVMNNFWETNFNASLAGFHQFHYDFFLTQAPDAKKALEQAQICNEGVLQFYLFEGEKEHV